MSVAASITVALPPEQEAMQQESNELMRELLEKLQRPQWMRVSAAAEYLSVSESTINKWMADGWLRFVKVEGVVRMNAAWLDEDIISKGAVAASNQVIPRQSGRKAVGRGRGQ